MDERGIRVAPTSAAITTTPHVQPYSEPHCQYRCRKSSVAGRSGRSAEWRNVGSTAADPARDSATAPRLRWAYPTWLTAPPSRTWVACEPAAWRRCNPVIGTIWGLVPLAGGKVWPATPQKPDPSLVDSKACAVVDDLVTIFAGIEFGDENHGEGTSELRATCSASANSFEGLTSDPPDWACGPR